MQWQVGGAQERNRDISSHTPFVASESGDVYIALHVLVALLGVAKHVLCVLSADLNLFSVLSTPPMCAAIQQTKQVFLCSACTPVALPLSPPTPRRADDDAVRQSSAAAAASAAVRRAVAVLLQQWLPVCLDQLATLPADEEEGQQTGSAGG